MLSTINFTNLRYVIVFEINKLSTRAKVGLVKILKQTHVKILQSTIILH